MNKELFEEDLLDLCNERLKTTDMSKAITLEELIETQGLDRDRIDKIKNEITREDLLK